MPKYRGTKV